MYPAPPAPGQAPGYAPHPAAGPWTPTPPYRPALPVTALPRTRPSGPGGRAFGVVVALGLILLASLLYAERVDAFDGPVMLTTAAGVVIMCGLGIAIAGAMGRRSGGLGAVAIITIFIVAPLSAVTDLSFDGNATFAGEGTYTPRTTAAAARGYNWAFGDVTVDLTELPAGADVQVPLHLGAGDLRVIVPEGAAVTADVRQGVGDVTWLNDQKVSGVGNDRRTYKSEAAESGATPDIELDVSMGAGSLTVVEGS